MKQYVMLFEEFKTSVNEKVEIHYSEDNIRKMDKANDVKSAMQIAKKLIEKPGIRDLAIFNAKPGFHSTAQDEYLIGWWGEGSYWDNVSKKDKEILKKKITESFFNDSNDSVNEAKTITYKRQYTEKHPAQSVGQYGKVRDRILETLKDGKMTKAEFDGIVKEFNLSSRWLRNNSSLFKTKGDVVSLSETGQRIYRAKSKVNEKDKK